MGPLIRLQAGTSTLSKPKDWTEASTRAVREHQRSCECDKDFIVFPNLPCKCSCSTVSLSRHKASKGTNVCGGISAWLGRFVTNREQNCQMGLDLIIIRIFFLQFLDVSAKNQQNEKAKLSAVKQK